VNLKGLTAVMDESSVDMADVNPPLEMSMSMLSPEYRGLVPLMGF